MNQIRRRDYAFAKQKTDCCIVVIDTGSDTDPIKRTISYGEYTDDALTPMSVVYQYIVYGIPKGQDKIIDVTYEFGSVWDELQHESGRLPVPEQ